MDRAIVFEKLESLRRCIARIQVKRCDSVEQLRNDVAPRVTVALKLTRAGQFFGGVLLNAH